jgi:hypothetical protein
MFPTLARTIPSQRSYFLPVLLAVCGVGGMEVSFGFLASSHAFDVTAGAAGFVAGAILLAAGQLSIAILDRRVGMAVGVREHVRDRVSEQPTLAVERWLAHFRRNQTNRVEPAWTAPITLAPDVVPPLVRSLEQFQLGDGGGPAYLIANNREKFLSQSPGARRLVDLWFAEEREHSRLLSQAVARFGGHCIESHWSFSAFCFTRKWFGVRFELTVLLLTEIVSTVYYRMLRRHCPDEPVRAMCRLILRDESGHVAFHRDRLARNSAKAAAYRSPVWRAIFRTLGFAAGTMLWLNHAPCLRALGGTTAEFYREVWQEESRFLRRLEAEADNQNRRV